MQPNSFGWQNLISIHNVMNQSSRGLTDKVMMSNAISVKLCVLVFWISKTFWCTDVLPGTRKMSHVWLRLKRFSKFPTKQYVFINWKKVWGVNLVISGGRQVFPPASEKRVRLVGGGGGRLRTGIILRLIRQCRPRPGPVRIPSDAKTFASG